VLAKVCSKVSEKHYPGRLHRAFIINAPNAVNAAWGCIAPFLDANAQELTSVLTKPKTLAVGNRAGGGRPVCSRREAALSHYCSLLLPLLSRDLFHPNPCPRR